MKLSELQYAINEQIRLMPRAADLSVCIKVDMPSIGPTAKTGVSHAHKGIDFDDGFFMIYPENSLVAK